MKLSILICTLPDRTDFLDRLSACLEADDHLHDNNIEVLINSSETDTIGKKRNKLLEEARGEYSVFIDDDDLVAPNYITLILKALESSPDVVNMNLIMTTDGKKAERSFHHVQFDRWFEIPDQIQKGYNVYFRCPNHLNPVKTEIARRVGFPEISMGEDRDYSLRLKKEITTSATIEQPIYFYLYRSNK